MTHGASHRIWASTYHHTAYALQLIELFGSSLRHCELVKLQYTHAKPGLQPTPFPHCWFSPARCGGAGASELVNVSVCTANISVGRGMEDRPRSTYHGRADTRICGEDERVRLCRRGLVV